MNVKIAENSVTFKISEIELKHLLSGNALSNKIHLGTSVFTILIDTKPSIYFEQIKDHALTLSLNPSDFSLSLNTTIEELKNLSDMGKNRDGLSTHINNLDVSLQVDIRKDSRQRKK